MRDDVRRHEDEVYPRPGIREVAEEQGDGEGDDHLAHVVEVPRGTPESVAEDLAVAGRDVFRFDEPQEFAVRPALERVLLHGCAARDAPAEPEQRSRAAEQDVGPRRRDFRTRLCRHAPDWQHVQPSPDHESAPEEFEAQFLVEQVVGIELDALEEEVVRDVERHERRKEKNARVGVRAKATVVIRGGGERVERQHRPTDDVEVHLYVEAVVEIRQLPRPPQPEGRDGTLYLAARLAEHRDDCQHERNRSAAGHRVGRRPVEPVAGHAGEFERPHDQREGKHQQAAQLVWAGFAGRRIGDVAGHAPARQDELRQEEHDEERQGGEKAQQRFRTGKREKVLDAKPFKHDR